MYSRVDIFSKKCIVLLLSWDLSESFLSGQQHLENGCDPEQYPGAQWGSHLPTMALYTPTVGLLTPIRVTQKQMSACMDGCCTHYISM